MSFSDSDPSPDDDGLFAYAKFGVHGDEKDAQERAARYRERLEERGHDNNWFTMLNTFLEGNTRDYIDILAYDDGTVHDILMQTVDMRLPDALRARLTKLSVMAAKLDPGRVIADYSDMLNRTHEGRKILRKAHKYRDQRRSAVDESRSTDPDTASIIKGYMGFKDGQSNGATFGCGCASNASNASNEDAQFMFNGSFNGSSNGNFGFDSDDEDEEKDTADASCQKCDNNRGPISLEPINVKTQGVFLFKQNNKCWCYLINNLYRAVFGTTVPTTVDKARIKNNKNPLNGVPIDPETLQRLVREYAIWYKAQGKGGDIIVDGITISAKDIEDFREGVNTMVMATGEMGSRQSDKRAAQMYIEDMEELADEDDAEEQAKIAKAKAIAKHLYK